MRHNLQAVGAAEWPPPAPHYREVLRMDKILTLLILLLQLLKLALEYLNR